MATTYRCGKHPNAEPHPLFYLCRHYSVRLMKSLPSVVAIQSLTPAKTWVMLFPSPLPAPPPISSRPPHLCPVSSPEADEGGNGPKWCSWEWVDYYRHSQFTSGFPNKRDAIAATIHLWRREKEIRFGGEEEKSRVLNQTQTGLRRGAGGGLEGAGYSRPSVRCHWLMGDIHHPVPQWQEAAAHEWDDRFSSGTRQMASGRKVELKIQRKTSRTRYLPNSRPCHQPHPGSGDANLNWLRRAINLSHKLFCGWSGSIADIFFEKLTIKQSFTPLLIACYE